MYKIFSIIDERLKQQCDPWRNSSCATIGPQADHRVSLCRVMVDPVPPARMSPNHRPILKRKRDGTEDSPRTIRGSHHTGIQLIVYFTVPCDALCSRPISHTFYSELLHTRVQAIEGWFHLSQHQIRWLCQHPGVRRVFWCEATQCLERRVDTWIFFVRGH